MSYTGAFDRLALPDGGNQWLSALLLCPTGFNLADLRVRGYEPIRELSGPSPWSSIKRALSSILVEFYQPVGAHREAGLAFSLD